MIPTVAVTVNFADQNGHPIVGGKVSATLTRDELYNGFIVPNQLTVVSDAAGVAVLDLFPNQLGSQGSQYIFRLTQPGGKTLSVTGTVPNAACALEDIVAMPASPAVPVGQQAVDTAIAAMGAASNSAAQALAIFTNAAAMQAAVTTTGTNAGEAAADVLLTHADVVTATAQAGIATTKAGEAAADVLLTHADVVTATAQAVSAALSAQHALVPSQALSVDHTVVAGDMGSMLLCTGPMTITFPAASVLGAYAVPIFIININIPSITISGLPALTNVLEFGQCEGFLCDGSSWRRMLGDGNSRVDKLRATITSAGTVVLTTDSLTPVALNQITPPINTSFEFAGHVLAKAVLTTEQNQKSALWKIEGVGYVDATAGTLVLFSVTITNPTSNVGWSVAVSADLVHGSIQISFTGDKPVWLIAEIYTMMLP